MSITNSTKEFKENNKELEATLSKRLDQNILIESQSNFIENDNKYVDIKNKLIESNFDKKLLSYAIELENFKRLGN